ncbi:related to siderophore esterase IroE-like [Cephalotrichum gorgonifer]|uniref:Related to siderophore esterase IroE-like n=1 Tax=Cephalotrichum gorgonifer TaxID=2041049 RepID=A0AAE8SXB7_9PEZI|nr:related to siderophore esterase IroE-like [Cephalotrichum gorgonifer]
MATGAQVHLPYTGTWDLDSVSGDVYRIQVAWPMHWMDRSGHSDVPVLYIVDGNALFLTAAEAAWRRSATPRFQGGGLVVAIGYPLQDKVFSPRRNKDLTPPKLSATSRPYGGAGDFLDFIEGTVKPFVAKEVLAGSTLGREALFGHSFGGLFSLYALFNRPSLFDCFIAASPSIWWDDRLILEYEQRFREGKWATQHAGKDRPALMIAFGTWEQDVPRQAGETEEEYQNRWNRAQERGMVDNAKALYGRLHGYDLLSGLAVKEYPGEDHGTVMACALSRFLTTFFEEWPISVGPPLGVSQ